MPPPLGALFWFTIPPVLRGPEFRLIGTCPQTKMLPFLPLLVSFRTAGRSGRAGTGHSVKQSEERRAVTISVGRAHRPLAP